MPYKPIKDRTKNSGCFYHDSMRPRASHVSAPYGMTSMSDGTTKHAIAHDAVHTVATITGAAEKGRHMLGKHIPGIFSKLVQGVELLAEVIRDEAEDPIEALVCGALSGTAKIATGTGIMTMCVLAPGLELPIVGAVFMDAVLTAGFGYAAQEAVSTLVDPVGDAVGRVCHMTFSQARKAKPMMINLPAKGMSPSCSAFREESFMLHRKPSKNGADIPAESKVTYGASFITDFHQTPFSTTKSSITCDLRLGSKPTSHTVLTAAPKQHPKSRTTMPKPSLSGINLSPEYQHWDDEIQRITIDELLNPKQRDQRLGEFFATKIHETTDSIKDAMLKEDHRRRAMNKGAQDLVAIGQLASDLSLRMGSDKGTSICKLATGAGMMGMALAVAPADFGVTAGCTFVMGLMSAGDGLGGLFGLGGHEDADNPMLQQLQAMTSALVQISQQMVVLGRYMEHRFDQLERTIGSHHTESMRFLRGILFHQQFSSAEMQALVKTLFQHNQEVLLHRLNALQTDVNELLQHQRQEAEVRMAHHDALLQELLFLQTQPDRRLVNEVKAALTRPEELAEQFETYSRRLSVSIQDECRGSQALTGADLPIDLPHLSSGKRELLRTRWLLPLEGVDALSMEPRLRKLTACNIDALVGFAAKHHALTGPVGELPNLVLLKDRVKAFLDLHQAHAKQVPHLSNSAKEHVEAVMHTIDTTRAAISSIDPKLALTACMAAFETHYSEMGHSIIAAQLAFEQKHMKQVIENRQKRLEGLSASLHDLKPPHEVMIPAENQSFSYQLNYKVAWHYAHIHTGWDTVSHGYRRHMIDDHLSPLTSIASHNYGHGDTEALYYFCIGRHYLNHPTNPESARCYSHNKTYTGPTEMGSFVLPWTSFDTKALDNLQHKLVYQWEPHDPSAHEHIHATRQTVGLSEKTEQKKMAEKHLERIVTQVKVVEGAGAIVQDTLKKQEHVALFKRDYLNLSANPALKSMMTLGPRLVRAQAGQSIDLILVLNDPGLDRWIPPAAFFAEDCGLGEIKLFYAVDLLDEARCQKIGRTDLPKDSQRLIMRLSIAFYPKDKTLKPVNFFSNAYKTEVSNAYSDDLQEPIYRWWYGDLLFSHERVNLSCLLFVHDNPFFKRVNEVTLSTSWSMHSCDLEQFKNATKAIEALVENHYLFQLRTEFNQQIKEDIQDYKGPLGEALLRSESMMVMAKCFAELSLHPQSKTIHSLLNRYIYQNRQQQLEYVTDWFVPEFVLFEREAKSYLGDDLLYRLSLDASSIKHAVLTEVDKAILFGDAELGYLYQELRSYLASVKLSPKRIDVSKGLEAPADELLEETDCEDDDEQYEKFEAETETLRVKKGLPMTHSFWRKPIDVPALNKAGCRVMSCAIFTDKAEQRFFSKSLKSHGINVRKTIIDDTETLAVYLPTKDVVRPV